MIFFHVYCTIIVHDPGENGQWAISRLCFLLCLDWETKHQRPLMDMDYNLGQYSILVACLCSISKIQLDIGSASLAYPPFVFF